jgi:MoaA/NifB/PqqE/SkfB family radical SAM enzyme
MASLVTIRDDVKIFESEDLSYNFNLKNGFTQVWGKTKEEDPEYSKYGPLIADIEITDICEGINGSLCNYCYKSNTKQGSNMSFETFKKIIKKLNTKGQLQQVAFGLGAEATENPELWDMCKWLRSKFIIPNGTVANVSKDTAYKIATNFGAVAVSAHLSEDSKKGFDVLAKNCLQFAPYIVAHHQGKKGITLAQLNIHFVIMEQTYEECKKLFKLLRSDPHFMAVNAVVLLGLKKCGRAEKGNFDRISDKHFKELVDIALDQKIGIGFDSCDCNRFLFSVKDRPNFKELEQMSEACESRLFSIYLNKEGKVFPCSFLENNQTGFDILNSNNFLEEYWNNDSDGWRKILINNNRSCPVYDV